MLGWRSACRQPQLVSVEERDRAILRLRRRGLAYAEIARKVGCSDTVVAKVIRRNTRPEPPLPGDADMPPVQEEQW